MTLQDTHMHAPIPGLVAAADYSASQFRAVRPHTTAGQVVIVSAIGQDGIGVLQNDPGSGQAAEIARPGGLCKAEAGAAITAGARVTVNASGQFIPLTTANATPSAVWGYAMSAAGASGEEFSLYLQQPTAPQIVVMELPIDLVMITASGNVFTPISLARFTNGGKILATSFAVSTSVVTASDAATLNLEIGGTDVTGGVVSLTSALAVYPNILAGSAITAANVFASTDTLEVEAVVSAAFADGAGTLRIEIQAF